METKLNAGREKAESERSYVASLKPDRTLSGEPQPHGVTQITRNELN